MLKTPITIACSLVLFSTSFELLATETLSVEQKIAALEAQNKLLLERLSALDAKLSKQTTSSDPSIITVKDVATAPVQESEDSKNFVQVNHDYGYAMLDPLRNINRKELVLLEQKKQGQLNADTIYLSGAGTGIVNYQRSNTESKFGYLMRHPTSTNQRTKDASEAVIHSAQFAITANLDSWLSAYTEFLYSPELSFGAGTITTVTRNQVQVHQGYVLLGDLNESPFYASLGKMAVPFGLTDTVSPFTQSTVYHAFGGLAYGLKGGYSHDNLNITAMAVQGGAQFRAANVPVDGSSVPSKLNNYAVDANYTFAVNPNTDLQLGGSYIKGSAYCQSFPVTHFTGCKEANGAFAVYSTLDIGQWHVKTEFAKTEHMWLGTFNPTIPQFAASKVDSLDLGVGYHSTMAGNPLYYSFEFSQFNSGPNDSPWERQDQWVLGLAYFPMGSAKFFTEVIQTRGYAPLNFISGGNLGDGVSWSVNDAASTVVMLGTNIAF